MPPSSPPDDSSIRPPHPLAVALIERLASLPDGAAPPVILDFATGSGRNAAGLIRAGFRVVAVGDDAAQRVERASDVDGGPFDAVVSTHGFLHGTAEDVARRVGTVAGMLRPRGLFYATFGSTADARFGKGRRLDASTYAPLDGDERGVAHAFFTGALLHEILSAHVLVERLEARGVDTIAGAWAHVDRPLENAAHWFAVARRG